MKLLATIGLLMMGFAMTGAHAQTVYRCGSTYSQAPCPQAKVVDVDDSRSAAQQAEAQRVADNERRLADDMQRDRLAQERATKPKRAGSLSGAPAKTARAERPLKKKRIAVTHRKPPHRAPKRAD